MNEPKSIALFGRVDWLFVLATFGLTLIGILFIYSASYRNDDEWMTALTRRQVLWALVGGFCFMVAILTDYRKLAANAWWIYGICLVLLGLVLVIGVKIYGAYRWLNLFGIQVQPSEFAKLGTLLLLARYLSLPSRDMSEFKTFYVTLLIMAAPFILVLRQPDLGTALMLLPVTLALLFVGGVPLRYLAILAGIGLLLTPLGWFALDGYQKERILVFFDPGRDPLGAGWNKIQSEIAVGSGGLTGKGFLMGTQNILGFLPRTVAPTDFIFSVIAEERGFVGAAVVLGLYAVMLISGIRAGIRARDKLGRLLAAGVTTMLFCHLFVNIAMTVGLAPITGLPLPLISYGGSFMVCTMAGLGLVQSVYVRRLER
ncbi:MAG TPA: rod shape-determining protein RodA [Kiritimatiellia bacterium]|nr:rod shape-determining protein RodA [Kiritimatiellia bacterium]HMO98102.1 rod shape-determining protein RodA [Kiritimatiellia bacterium]HMP96318.1 rod shape-determining protein RodA [Kiritimatiellia bacterium]